jgi:hypothetical protein
MRKVLMPAFLLSLGSALLGATVLHEPLAHAAQAIFISNDSSNPVPVQEQRTDANGNIKVHEQGTANVNVGNFPPTQQITGTVGINANANGVKEVNSVAVRPFSARSAGTFGAGTDNFRAVVDLFTVPPGQRLVLTYASAEVHVNTGGHAILHLTDGVSNLQLGEIPLTDAGEFNVPGEREFLTGAGLVNVVYGPGDHVIVRAFRSQGEGDNTGSVSAAVTGYTVPIS